MPLHQHWNDLTTKLGKAKRLVRFVPKLLRCATREPDGGTEEPDDVEKPEEAEHSKGSSSVEEPDPTTAKKVSSGDEATRIPLQQSLIHHDPEFNVLTNVLADTSCAKIGITELHVKLNHLCMNSVSPNHPGVRATLQKLIDEGCDLGTAYARLRLQWTKIPAEHFDLAERMASLDRWGDEYERFRRVTGGTISNPHRIRPRRLWDLAANRVVPCQYGLVWNLYYHKFWAVSHSWTDDMVGVDTIINGHEWPVPLPAGIDLESIRTELLNHKAQYAWLDVLCLRQKSASIEREKLRMKEWAVDVPTIGAVYNFGADHTLWYMNGLGRAFKRSDWGHPRHWLSRAWTLQEMKRDPVIGAIPEGISNPLDERSLDSGELLRDRLRRVLALQSLLPSKVDAATFMLIIEIMRERISTNPVDKVAGVTIILQPPTFPVYNEKMGEKEAWLHCVRHLPPTVWAALLFGIATPGDDGISWRPSWDQLMKGKLPELSGWSPMASPRCVTPDGLLICEASVAGVQLVSLSTETVEGRKKNNVSGKMVCEDYEDPFDFDAEFASSAPEMAKGEYVLVGNMSACDPFCWVVCEREENMYRKLTVVMIPDRQSSRLRLIPQETCFFK